MVANSSAQTLQGIGRDVQPPRAGAVSAQQGGSRTSTHRAEQSSAQLPWALWWQCQAGQPLGLTHHCSHQGFPNSLADLWLSWALLLSLSGGHRAFPEHCCFQRQLLCLGTDHGITHSAFTPCFPRLISSCSWHPWAAALSRKAICFFSYYFAKSSINVVLPGVPSCSITDSSLPCELPLYVYATSKL